MKRRTSVISADRGWLYPAAVAVEMPIGLNHLDTDFCWCDPIVEIDDNGREIVLHRQVTWN
jgi:hypothetical protein